MDKNEKALARILFQNKIFKSDGQKFEDLFCDIISYVEPDFRKIKAWGNIGDRKNDGYIESKGIFYQVYSPEDIRNNYTEIVSKIERDFKGLISQWKNVKEFYFVVNDKYKGVNADAEQTLKKIAEDNKLSKSGFITADNLNQILFSLKDNEILDIVGFLPNIDRIVNLDYSVLHEVVGFIMKLPIKQIFGEIKYPDWDEKIEINNLSSYPKYLLNHGSQTIGALNKFLSANSTLADDLQKQLTGIYATIKKTWIDYQLTGDNIFWELINECSPKQENPYQSAVITILAKYFESCDIFEEPKNKDQ